MGYPKCFSTSLQTLFFANHPEIDYGGVGIGDHISYANKDLEFAFESLLQHAHHSFYKRHLKEAKDTIDAFVSQSQNTAVFSLETLIFPFSSLDLETILVRMQQLFEGYEINLLLIFREQYGFLKSLYGEFVRMGYPETFSKYIQWVWGYRDRNFWELLDYSHIFNLLTERFGEDKVHIHFFETFKKDPETLINQKLSETLQVTNKQLPIWNEYPSLKENELANLLYINQQFPRGMGEHVLYPFLNHHNRVILSRLEAGYTNEEIFENVLSKRLAMVKMNRIPPQPCENIFTLYSPSEAIFKKMESAWKTSNSELAQRMPTVPKNYLL